MIKTSYKTISEQHKVLLKKYQQYNSILAKLSVFSIVINIVLIGILAYIKLGG